jgi:hypothetical protein
MGRPLGGIPASAGRSLGPNPAHAVGNHPRRNAAKAAKAASPLWLAPRLSLAMVGGYVSCVTLSPATGWSRILRSCLCSCLINEEQNNEPDMLAKHRTTPCLPIGTLARWGPGRHLAGTAARTVHRVQSERAQCVPSCDEYKRYLGVDLRSGKSRRTKAGSARSRTSLPSRLRCRSRRRRCHTRSIRRRRSRSPRLP